MPTTHPRITAANLPTPDYALRAGVDEKTVRGFADTAARAAATIYRDLEASWSLTSPQARYTAVRDAYEAALAWRYNLATVGAITGGVNMVPATAERFRTPITDETRNIDRIGYCGQLRDGARWDGGLLCYTGGSPTPASRITDAYGNAARARFAAECPDAEILDNPVRLPDGTRVTGNRIVRGRTALRVGEELAARVAARGLDASRMEIGGDPVYVITAGETARTTIREAALRLAADDPDYLTTARWWQIAYLLYQAPQYKKGSDAAHRVFLLALGALLLRRPPVIRHDIDLWCMVLGQTAATTTPAVLDAEVA